MAPGLSPGQIPEPIAPSQEEQWRENLNVHMACPDCQEFPPNIIEEFSSGDTVCGSCGLVLGGRIVDTRSEWRTFANDESGSDDPSRVGGIANPLLDGSQLDTQISWDNGGVRSRELHRAHNKMNQDKSQKGLKESFGKISAYSAALTLPDNAVEVVQQCFKAIEESKAFKGKPQDIVIAACILIACRQTGNERSFKDVCAHTHTPKKEVGRVFKALCQFFGGKEAGKVKDSGLAGATLSEIRGAYQATNTSQAFQYVERYCDELLLTKQATKAARLIATKIQETGSLAGRSPLSAVAVCIYMASYLMGDPRTPKEISKRIKVSDGTIRNAYKLTYPDKEKLIDPSLLGEGKGDVSRLPAA